jgi:hypothetical protein
MPAGTFRRLSWVRQPSCEMITVHILQTGNHFAKIAETPSKQETRKTHEIQHP